MHGLQNTLRSATFMAAYVQIFQILLCLHRGAIRQGWIAQDWRYLYWLMGAISGLSLPIENKHRRTELTLFVSRLSF